MSDDAFKISNERCTACGMNCAPGEYHPYAACLMYRECHSQDVVRANLQQVVAHGRGQVETECSECAENLQDAQRANVMQDHLAGALTQACELLRKYTASDYTLELPPDVQAFVEFIQRDGAGIVVQIGIDEFEETEKFVSTRTCFSGLLSCQTI